MSGVIVELEQGTPAWANWRFSGFGGSDAPASVEKSPYKTRYQLAVEKLNKREIQDDSKEFIFGRGHKLEKVARQQFQDLIGDEARPICMVHPKFSQLIVSLDGLNPKYGILEAKHVGAEVLKLAEKDGTIPEHHMIQIQHAMNVSGADLAQWYGLDNKGNGVLVEVRRDERIIQPLQDAELELWDLIQSGKLPPLGPLDYFEPENTKLLEELRDAKELMDNAEMEFDRLKAAVIDSCTHPRISGGGLKVYQSERMGSIDWLAIPQIAEIVETIKSSNPELMEQYRKKSTVSWTVSIPKVKVK